MSYAKQNFKPGQKLEAKHLNVVENGIIANENAIKAIENKTISNGGILAANTDFNTITTSGIYNSSSEMPNSPDAGPALLIVVNEDNFITQLYINTATGRHYARRYTNKTWTVWRDSTHEAIKIDPNNNDMNNILEPGEYYTTSSETYVNLPDSGGGYLTVIRTASFTVQDYTNVWLGSRYVRYYHNKTWKPWKGYPLAEFIVNKQSVNNNTDLNNLTDNGAYIILESRTYINLPEKGIGVLTVFKRTDGYLYQNYVGHNTGNRYARWYNPNTKVWSQWYDTIPHTVMRNNQALPADTDLNTLIDNGIHILLYSRNYLNQPEKSIGVLNVYKRDDGYVYQDYISYSTGARYVRWAGIKDNSWNEWTNDNMMNKHSIGSNGDFNDFIENGFYYAALPNKHLNSPDNTTGGILTVTVQNAVVTQIFTSVFTAKTYSRYSINGEWTPWNDSFYPLEKAIEELQVSSASGIIQSKKGNICTFENSAISPLADLKIHGRTFITNPTTGKNLFPTPLTETYASTNGITIVRKLDGSIVISGTAEDLAATYIPLPYEIPANTSFAISLNNTEVTGEGDTNILIRLVSEPKYVSSMSFGTIAANSLNKKSVAIGTEKFIARGIQLRIAKGNVLDNFTIKPQIELGEQATEWERYSEGEVAPTPKYPVNIENVGESKNIKIEMVGTNFLPYPYSFKDGYTNHNIVANVFPDGSVSVTGTNNQNSKTYFYLTKYSAAQNQGFPIAAGRYYVSGRPEESFGIATLAFSIYKDGKFITGGGFGPSETTRILNVPEDALCNCYIAVEPNATVENLVFKPMITPIYGELPYIQEGAQYLSFATPQGFNGILSSEGNYVDKEGNTWVTDCYDYKQGIKIQAIQHITLDGTLDPYSILVRDNSVRVIFNGFLNAKPQLNQMCNRFKQGAAYSKDIVGFIVASDNTGSVILGMPLEVGSTKESVKNWLAENPVEIYYILDEPIISQIPATEIKKYKALQSYNSITTIRSLQLPEIEASCKLDTSAYIDAKTGGRDSSAVYYAFGDSTTYGQIAKIGGQSRYNYPDCVGRSLDMKVINKAKGGQGLIKDWDFIHENYIDKLDMSDAKLVTIGWAYNDGQSYYGTIDIGTALDTTADTYVGKYYTIMKEFQDKCPQAQIVLITGYGILSDSYSQFKSGYYFANDEFHSIKEMYDLLEEMCHINGWCCINQAKGSWITKYNYKTYVGDGIHPTNEGYIRYSNYIVAKISSLYSNLKMW